MLAFDVVSGAPLNLAGRINACCTQQQQAEPLALESETLQGLEAYDTKACCGSPIAPPEDARLVLSLEHGRRLFEQRMGKLAPCALRGWRFRRRAFVPRSTVVEPGAAAHNRCQQRKADMSNDLRDIYQGAGALDRFFEQTTPVDLFRGRRLGDATDLMQPTLIGWYQKLRPPRRPDVKVVDSRDESPQYEGGDLSKLVTESKSKPRTAEIVRDADKYIVKGCRTMKGDHRGISVFDKKNPGLPNFEWYKLGANTAIPPGLAITRDATFKTSPDPIHYTVAPKDDMPLALFLQTLKGLADLARKD